MPVVFQRDMNVPKDSNHSPQLYVCISISQTVNYMQLTSSTSSEKKYIKKTPLFISVNSVRSTSIDIFFNFQDKYL